MATYPRTGMQRILVGSIPVLRVTLLDQDGEPAEPTGALTCTVARADGTSLGDRAVTGIGGGALTAQLLAADAAELDVLTAVWSVDGVTRATSHHAIVGGFLFSIAQLDELGGLSGYTPERKREVRDEVTDLIERWTGVAWSPRYTLDDFTGHGRSSHAVRDRPLRRIRSLIVDGSTIDVADIEVDEAAGIMRGYHPLTGRVLLGYDNGFDQPTTLLRDAALQAAKHRLLNRDTSLGKRVRSITDDQGTRTFSFAGNEHPTGIDDIDAVIMAHDHRDPQWR